MHPGPNYGHVALGAKGSFVSLPAGAAPAAPTPRRIRDSIHISLTARVDPLNGIVEQGWLRSDPSLTVGGHGRSQLPVATRAAIRAHPTAVV